MKRFFRVLIKCTFRWIILPLVFFYLLIWLVQPDRYLVDRIVGEVRSKTGVDIGYSDVKMGPTGRITIENLSVRKDTQQEEHAQASGAETEPRSWFSCETMTIRLNLKGLLQRKNSLRFSGKAYNGFFSGSVEAPMRRVNTGMDIDLEWDSVNMANLADDHPNLKVQTGLCSGKADLHADLTRTFSFSGPVDLSIRDTKLAAPGSFKTEFDLPDFNSITAKLTLHYADIHLDEVKLISTDTIARIMGWIHQKLPAEDTVLDLEVRLHLISENQPFNEEMYIPLTISGSAADPEVSFLGRNIRSGIRTDGSNRSQSSG